MKQVEKIYMISDAAKQVKVEAHVLRYWEEELELPVKRNEMGHRYYTEEDVEQFRKIRELKEQGMQLKGIRNILKNGTMKESADVFDLGVEKEEESEGKRRHVVMVKKGEFLSVPDNVMPMQEESKEQKSLRLQQLLRDMITEAVAGSNQKICMEIKSSILKELDYQFRLQEEREDSREKDRIGREEDHYQRIDELLRSHQQKKRKGLFKNGLTGKKRSIE